VVRSVTKAIRHLLWLAPQPIVGQMWVMRWGAIFGKGWTGLDSRRRRERPGPGTAHRRVASNTSQMATAESQRFGPRAVAGAFCLLVLSTAIACATSSSVVPTVTSTGPSISVAPTTTEASAFSATPGEPTSSPKSSGTPSMGLSEADAISMARVYSGDPNAQVREAISGTFEDVYAALVHVPPGDSKPSVDDQRLVWGVEFVQQIDFCPYLSTDCYLRPALRSVWIDYVTGDFVQASTYSPAPGEPLPPD